MAGDVREQMDQLKGLDRRTRREEVQALIAEGTLDRNGLTLFRYHILPSLQKDKWIEPDITTGLRWNKMTEETHRCWVRQTVELVRGSVTPLNPETFEDFQTGRLCSQGTEIEDNGSRPAQSQHTNRSPNPSDNLPDPAALGITARHNSTRAND